ncbi:MAG: bifunctional UDP-N-acetylglucosamine diphosphorylase/glucosamine-1-phosphate N-acetyltransferase GlmU [Gammaproteobacteria bacterium]|nr:MAG: bifunctional UDP-N-acetylglucosamine diphosphorylase/glucosamine-1-phosphate N-acetyltransferase GlmU [Gammaproteobacteria bacterium]
MSLHVVILAAGLGKRMRSKLPKVLNTVGGRPMLEHVLRTARQLSPDAIHVVYGHGGDLVKAQLNTHDINWVHQEDQLGTGHATRYALDHVASDADVLVLYGDVPLIKAQTLRDLRARQEKTGVAILTVELNDPTGYGRIIRNASGNITAIVEEKDANDEQRAISESNTGILACHADQLVRWLENVDPDNAQGEIYLTDIIELAVAEGCEVGSIIAHDPIEVSGVNDRKQQAEAERALQQRKVEALMEQGVTVMDPVRLDVRGDVTVGHDVTIDINVILEGKVEIGDAVHIGPNVQIRNTTIGNGVEVRANCVIEEANIGNNAIIGPFARIRPGTRICDQAHIGNFVEIKKSHIGKDSKICHLTYVGDSHVGERVNIGAGTITCNYDVSTSTKPSSRMTPLSVPMQHWSHR